MEAVLALEAVLGIVERWTAGSQQYKDAMTRMAERDWRRALDRLEHLMVQRMFELAKSHTFGTGKCLASPVMRANAITGYKMREAISKGLKARSQAIRTAVTRYNELAEALTPPAPTVTFATLMEWTELQEFELLRHSRSGDIRDKPWAQPANRLMAVKHYKVARAHEELLRCRVETRRLVTAMRDEEAHFEQVHERLLSANDMLAFELREHITRRQAVNATHRARLAKLASSAGFGPALVPGTRIGADPSETPRGNTPTQPLGERVGEGVLDDLDGPDPVVQEELHRLHDYLAGLE